MSSVFVKELNGGEEFRAANIVELFLSLILIFYDSFSLGTLEILSRLLIHFT